MPIRSIEMLGSEVLRTKAAPVESVDDDIRKLVRDLYDTMYHADGIGLAAPQVGISLRLCVLDVSSGEEGEERAIYALVNPEIVEASSKTEKGVEGCLSIPGIEESVIRPASVVVEALNEHGEAVREEFRDDMSELLQHEIDHLDGVLFLDHLSPLKRGFALKKWRKNRAEVASG